MKTAALIVTTGLVVGPEDKKAERQFARNGGVFLRSGESTDFFQGLN